MDFLVAFASFGVGVALAELFGASNLGVAFGFGQIAFAVCCVVLIARGAPAAQRASRR
jgi:hypothetical protein